MRRRARRHGPKGPPSSIHLAYLSRVRLYSAPLLRDHPDPCPRESQREISLFAPPLLSSGIPESRGRAERKRIPARVPGSDPKPSALWTRLPSSSAEKRNCKRLLVRAD